MKFHAAFLIYLRYFPVILKHDKVIKIRGFIKKIRRVRLKKAVIFRSERPKPAKGGYEDCLTVKRPSFPGIPIILPKRFVGLSHHDQI